MERWPIWIADEEDPTKAIGVEAAFDIEIERRSNISEVMRFIGQIDRLHEVTRENETKLVLGENKTGARLDDSWASAFDMSHQITGYQIAAFTITQRHLVDAKVYGMKNKQTGHAEDINPITPQPRTGEAFETFIDWAFDAKAIYDKYMNDWEHAPRYTHSCNRYFRKCAMLPFCTDTRAGRKEQFKEMVQADLSPSEQAVLDGIGMLDL